MKPDAAKRCAGFHLFERRGECGGEEGAGEKSEKTHCDPHRTTIVYEGNFKRN